MKSRKRDRGIVLLLTPEQWLGVVLLLLTAGGTVALLHFLPRPENRPMVSDSARTAFEQYSSRQDSLRKARYRRDTIAICRQAFDPNTADSSTLVRVGLRPWQARNLLKYREKGGRYRKAEDMKRLYGMTDSLYALLAPYIVIAADSTRTDSLRRDTLPYTLPHHTAYKRDTVLNLRTADTATLRRIRGIGTYTAREIVRYRTRLGGYMHVEQLMEIRAVRQAVARQAERDSLYTQDSLLRHFFIDSAIVVQIPVNHATVEQLQRHPYLSFTQAKAIYGQRRRHIHIDTAEELQTLVCMDSVQWQRVVPYLSFER